MMIAAPKRSPLPLIAALAGCSHPPVKPVSTDVCNAPYDKGRLTPEAAKKQGISIDPIQLDMYNSSMAWYQCLRSHAYMARNLKDPMNQMVPAIMAQCDTEFGQYEYSKHPLKSLGDHRTKTEKMSADIDREDDPKDKQKEILGEILDYRTCASGVLNNTVESFSKPADSQ